MIEASAAAWKGRVSRVLDGIASFGKETEIPIIDDDNPSTLDLGIGRLRELLDESNKINLGVETIFTRVDRDEDQQVVLQRHFRINFQNSGSVDFGRLVLRTLQEGRYIPEAAQRRPRFLDWLTETRYE